MPDIYGRNKDDKMWSDYARPSANASVMQSGTQNGAQINGAQNTQNPPIVQPLVIVPYSSQMQPLYQYSPDSYGFNPPYDDEEAFYEEESPAFSAKAKKAKKAKKEKRGPARGVNGGAVAATIFGLLALAIVVASYFLSIPYINITGDENAIGIALGVVSAVTSIIGGAFETTMLFTVGITVALAFTVLTFIASAFSFRGKYPVIGKIFAIIALAGVVLAGVIMFVNKMEIGYGAYAFAGLIVLMAISALAGKRRA